MSTTKIRASQIFGITGQFAPQLRELIPDSYLPNNTGDFIFKGSFFTPTTTVVIEGQTVNSITFLNDNELKINVTTGPTEGTFDITLNNGIEAIFENALFIVLGEVFTPVEAEYTDVVQPITIEPGAIKTKTYGGQGGAIWSREFDITKDWVFKYRIKKSPLGAFGGASGEHVVSLFDAVDNTEHFYTYTGGGGAASYITNPMTKVSSAGTDTHHGNLYEVKLLDGIMVFYLNGAVKATSQTVFSNNVKAKFLAKYVDIIEMRYIELAT